LDLHKRRRHSVRAGVPAATRLNCADRQPRARPGVFGPAAGVTSSTILFDNGHEQVRIEDWQPGATLKVYNPDGLELLVLSGNFGVEQDALERLSWLRLPAGMGLTANVGLYGAHVWLKAGLLLQDKVVEF
jgi:hypothetical protein